MDRSKRFTLCAFPGRPVHSDTNSASPGSILVRQQLQAKTKSLTCPPLSIARYSFIQLSQLGPQWRERKCPIFETVAKGDSNPGSLDCESGILPLSYRTPLNVSVQYIGYCFCIMGTACDVTVKARHPPLLCLNTSNLKTALIHDFTDQKFVGRFVAVRVITAAHTLSSIDYQNRRTPTERITGQGAGNICWPVRMNSAAEVVRTVSCDQGFVAYT